MKNKIPKLVKELLKKYDLYYNCCDVCDIRCCKGHTILTIDDIDYIVNTTGVVPVLVQYPIVPVAVAPTTLINAPVGTTLVIPTNNDGGCAGGFISETVTITGGGLNIPITTFPANLCALLDNLAVTSGTTELTITSNVATACGTASDTLILPIVEVGGLITTIDGVDCSPVPPTTVINPTVATLIAPNNNDGGCVGGFISETVTITGGGLNVPVSSFPADLCALLSGLPVTLGTNLLTITSDVATACGTATHAIGITVSEVGGFITQINGTSCTPKFSLLKTGSAILFNNSKTYLNINGINGLLDDAPYQDLSLTATYNLYNDGNALLASGTIAADNTDQEILPNTLPTNNYYYYYIEITDSFGNMHQLNSWFYVDTLGNLTDSLYQVTSIAYDNLTTTLSVGVGGTSWADLPVNDGSVDYLNDNSLELTGAGVASSWAINAALTTTWNALKVVRKNTLYPSRESYIISWLKIN